MPTYTCVMKMTTMMVTWRCGERTDHDDTRFDHHTARHRPVDVPCHCTTRTLERKAEGEHVLVPKSECIEPVFATVNRAP
jgi:hypothetical protein